MILEASWIYNIRSKKNLFCLLYDKHVLFKCFDSKKIAVVIGNKLSILLISIEYNDLLIYYIFQGGT